MSMPLPSYVTLFNTTTQLYNSEHAALTTIINENGFGKFVERLRAFHKELNLTLTPLNEKNIKDCTTQLAAFKERIDVFNATVVERAQSLLDRLYQAQTTLQRPPLDIHTIQTLQGLFTIPADVEALANKNLFKMCSSLEGMIVNTSHIIVSINEAVALYDKIRALFQNKCNPVSDSYTNPLYTWRVDDPAPEKS